MRKGGSTKGYAGEWIVRGNKQQVVVTLAGVFWSLGVALMVMATLIPVAMLVVAGWALMCGLWATVWTVWALLLAERHRVETICRLTLAGDDDDGLRSV